MDLSSLPPGFGFHPTDAELICYLRRKVLGLKIPFGVDGLNLNLIPDIDIYKHEPWDLAPLTSTSTQDTKWHFFTPRDKKYPNATGSRANRATKLGYWKSTGKDRNIKNNHTNQLIGTKKTLVFHQGRPPAGTRTQWIMHEFYLHPNSLPRDAPAHLKDLFVLCRVTKRHEFDDHHYDHHQDQQPLHHDDLSSAGAGAGANSSTGPSPSPNTSTSANTSASTSAVLNPLMIMPDDTILHVNTTTPNTNTNTNTNNNTDHQQDDLDNWLQELFDPNFTATSLLPPQSNVGSTLSASKPEPAYYSPAQASEDETLFLLPEDIQTILGTHNHQNTQNLHFLQDQTTPTSSAFYCNVPGYSSKDDETGIVIRRRSTTATYVNPNDTDVSNINKYNPKSKLQVHLYKKGDKTLQTANFAPKDGLVGEFDNSESISANDGNDLKSTMPARTKPRGFVHMGTLMFGALLVGGIAMLLYFVSNNSTIFS